MFPYGRYAFPLISGWGALTTNELRNLVGRIFDAYLQSWLRNPVRKVGFVLVYGGIAIAAASWPQILTVVGSMLGWAVPREPDFTVWFGPGFAAVGLLIILGEVAYSRLPANPDQLTFDRLRIAMPRDTVNLVRDHQFANGVWLDAIRPAMRLAEDWRGAETSFEDSDMQSILNDLVGAAQRLTVIVQQDMHPIDSGSEFMLLRDPTEEFHRPRCDVIDDLKVTRLRFSTAYDNLIHRAKKAGLSV